MGGDAGGEGGRVAGVGDWVAVAGAGAVAGVAAGSSAGGVQALSARRVAGRKAWVMPRAHRERRGDGRGGRFEAATSGLPLGLGPRAATRKAAVAGWGVGDMNATTPATVDFGET